MKCYIALFNVKTVEQIGRMFIEDVKMNREMLTQPVLAERYGLL